MSNEQINLKLKQFDEFFSIKHEFNINAQLLDDINLSYDDFLLSMPTAFKLANDIDSIDQAALAPLGAITGIAGQLVKYLELQAQKIDLLVNHMLNEQDDKEYRYQGISFGGGGISFIHNQPFSLNKLIALKVFLPHENCAVYCHAEIISVEKEKVSGENTDTKYLHKVIFHHIREDDRERLVRSSLHLQSKQLQKLARERNKQPNQ